MSASEDMEVAEQFMNTVLKPAIQSLEILETDRAEETRKRVHTNNANLLEQLVVLAGNICTLLRSRGYQYPDKLVEYSRSIHPLIDTLKQCGEDELLQDF